MITVNQIIAIYLIISSICLTLGAISWYLRDKIELSKIRNYPLSLYGPLWLIVSILPIIHLLGCWIGYLNIKDAYDRK